MLVPLTPKTGRDYSKISEANTARSADMTEPG